MCRHCPVGIVCEDGKEAANSEVPFEQHMRATFTILAKLPYAVINVPLHPDYTQLADADWGFFGGLTCDTILSFVCSCLGSGWTTEVRLVHGVSLLPTSAERL